MNRRDFLKKSSLLVAVSAIPINFTVEEAQARGWYCFETITMQIKGTHQSVTGKIVAPDEHYTTKIRLEDGTVLYSADSKINFGDIFVIGDVNALS